VSDLWPDAGIEIGLLKKGLFYNILKRVELYNYRNVNKILGQSDEILEHIRNLAPSTELYLYRNYPIIDTSAFSERNTDSGPIKIVYAGLLGIAQGILRLCQNLSFNNVEFHIYGAGPEAFELQQYIESQPGLPIFFHGSLDRKSLHKEIINYDLALIPLVNRIYGSVPSKIFEYALLGLPLLYFGGGEGESIVINHRLGWVVEHGDYGQLNSVINSIGYEHFKQYSKKEIRERAKRAFSFDRQMEQIKAIL
jgi:glycosyltransferase involved in cell wall biosynthesis